MLSRNLITVVLVALFAFAGITPAQAQETAPIVVTNVTLLAGEAAQLMQDTLIYTRVEAQINAEGEAYVLVQYLKDGIFLQPQSSGGQWVYPSQCSDNTCNIYETWDNYDDFGPDAYLITVSFNGEVVEEITGPVIRSVLFLPAVQR